MSQHTMRFKSQGIYKADRKEVSKSNTKPDPKNHHVVITGLTKTNLLSLWKSKPCRLLVVRQTKTRITLSSSHTVLIHCLFKT